MTDVFISYKSDDREQVQPLVEALRRAGLSIWWDRDIPASAPWEATITAALESAKCVIVCWTAQSVHPTFGQKVQVEAREALEQGKLLQVMLENVRPPLFFRQNQALDLITWRGAVENSAFQQLTQAARDLVAGRRPALPELAGAPRKSGGGAMLALLGAVVLAGIAGGIFYFKPFQTPVTKPQSETTQVAQTQPAQTNSAPPRPEPARQQAPIQATSTVAQPPPAAPAPQHVASPSYSGRTYNVELEGCSQTGDGALCTTYVTANNRIAWHFNDRSYLADGNGGRIPAVDMTIGNDSRNVSNQGYQVIFSYLEPGIRTRITYHFSGPINPSEIQALVIAVDAPLSRRSATLSPVPWH